MKSLIGFALVVLVLVVAGDAVRRAGLVQERLAAAQEQLTTTGRVTQEADGGLDASLALVSRIPLLGARIARQVREQRAQTAYWQGDYAALAPVPAAAAATPEDNPALLLLTANAGFRSAVLQNRTAPTLVRSLDGVLKAYAAVLTVDPTSTDAAYNYEFVVRLRTVLAAGRGAAVPAARNQNMQGEEGEPPMGTQQSDFKVIVPLRPEERQEQMDPGAGASFQRKG